MNWKTTALLLLLAGGCAALFWKGPQYLSKNPAEPAAAGESAELLAGITPQKLRGLEVSAAGKVLLRLQSPAAGGPLELVGNWPVRRGELDELLAQVTRLESRFAPLPLAEAADRKKYGLDPTQEPIQVVLQLEKGQRTLLFGRPPLAAGENRFTQPTYVRLDQQPEALRVSPQAYDLLRRTEEDYRLRRLFPEKVRLRVAEEVSPNLGAEERPTTRMTEIVDDRVVRLEVSGPAGSYTLQRAAATPGEKPLASRPETDPFVTPLQVADSWKLVAPVSDRVDPVKLRTILAAVADLWVDRFLDPAEIQTLQWPGKQPGVRLAPEGRNAAGLLLGSSAALVQSTERPTLRLTYQDGSVRVLRVGPVTRSERKAEPPPQLPGMPPMPPRETVEEWRAAQLGDSPLVFEVKADRLKELFTRLDADLTAAPAGTPELRDAQWLRFTPASIRRVEVAGSKRTPLTLTRGESAGNTTGVRWDLVKPTAGLAENGPIDELLSTLSTLSSSADDFLSPQDSQNLAAWGLDEPNATRVLLKGVGVDRMLLLGKRESGKVYVRLIGREGVGRVDDRVVSLLDRNVQVYRSRKLFDLAGSGPEQASRISALKVTRGTDSFELIEQPGLVTRWQLAPAGASPTPADGGRVNSLVAALGGLQVVEFLPDPQNPVAGGSVLGGALPGQQSTQAAGLGLEPPQLTVGLRFAGPRKLPEQTLQIGNPVPGKQELYARLAGQPGTFTIARTLLDSLGDGALAFLPLELVATGPGAIESLEITRAGQPAYQLRKAGAKWSLATPTPTPVDTQLLEPLLGGLGALRAERYHALSSRDAALGLEPPQLQIRFTGEGPTRERVLRIGNLEGAGSSLRYARLDDEPAVFLVGDDLFRAADRGPFDWLNRNLLSLNTAFATRVEVATPAGTVVLSRQQNPWKAEGLNFPLDQPTLDALLNRFKSLNAERIADVGATIPLANYGLDAAAKPSRVVLALDRETHTVLLGKPVDASKPNGPRYARVDESPAVAVLDASTVADLSPGRLDFVDRTLLRFDPVEVQALTRVAGSESVEWKQGLTGGWEMLAQGATRPADSELLEEISARLSRLRAERIVELDAKDAARFGLQTTLTIDLIDSRSGRPLKRVVQIGNPVDASKPEGDRFVRVEGSSAVGVLAAPLARRLTAPPLKFLNRTLAAFPAADRIELTQGGRALTFQKEAGWKLKAPVDADAEDEALRDLHDRLARLRADEVVAEKPQKLAEYGLDAPEIRWRLFAGTREVLNLEIGKREANDFRRYARLNGGELVVLLDRTLSDRLEAEYRKRTLGERLEPAQVSELILQQGASRTTLTRVGGDWVDPARPDLKFNAARVGELVEVACGAQVQRYVADTQADLARFGLAPAAARTLTVRGGMGQTRTLVLGSADATGQLYARREDPTRLEVFVLSASDSQRLKRGVPDLLDRELLPKPKEK